MNERNAFSPSGIPAALILIASWLLTGYWLLNTHGPAGAPPHLVTIGLVFVLLAFLSKGFLQVQPNQGVATQFFGHYSGTVRDGGLRWTNLLYSKHAISLRVRNFESGKLKVNDSDGNPIEIAAVVVWQVVYPAEAMFCVDDYENFVQIQTESALRQMAQSYPYDSHDDVKPSLRSHGDLINSQLRDVMQTRLGTAGVKFVESRISHLAYAQEIGQAMLERQKAGAIIAARMLIVEGAVSMVEMAFDRARQTRLG